MEGPSPSERVAPVGGDDDRNSVRGYLRVDGKWKRQRIHEGAPGRRSFVACMSFVQKHHSHLSLTAPQLDSRCRQGIVSHA